MGWQDGHSPFRGNKEDQLPEAIDAKATALNDTLERANRNRLASMRRDNYFAASCKHASPLGGEDLGEGFSRRIIAPQPEVPHIRKNEPICQFSVMFPSAFTTTT